MRATRLLALLAATSLAAGTVVAVTAVNGQAATPSWSYDTGAGLVVTFNPTNGNLTSLRHRGVELGARGFAAGQVDSGWASATVTRQDVGTTSVFTVANAEVTQYYVLRKNDNTVYMATRVDSAHDPLRFIARLDDTLLPTSPVAARTAGSTTVVEGSDVFRFADGTTASKFYSAQPLLSQQPFGASGPAHGVFVLPGRQELTAGGPFFRDHEVNATGTAVNLTQVLHSAHYQTEGQRFGMHGPYALTVTDGGPPVARSMDWLADVVPGLPAAAGRGTVTGTASGDARGLPWLAALSGPSGQYWAAVTGSAFTISGVRPGSYTATLYAGQLAVGAPVPVTVTAGGTTDVALQGDVPAPGTIAQLGTLDGTPAGFLNADKIERMHPSDVRMGPWVLDAFDTTKDTAAAFPMAHFKDVDGELPVTFPLASVPPAGLTVRIATTGAFAGGRPQLSVGSWTSPVSASPAPAAVAGRGITRGAWRGFNRTYTFTVPASALQTGSNTLTIRVISGSSGATFLSPNYVFDAISVDPA